MDEVKEVVDKISKAFDEPKRTLTYLAEFLTRQSDFFTSCLAIVNTCLYLKDTNPEAIKPNLQYMQQLQERFDDEMRKKFELSDCSYVFDQVYDLNQLADVLHHMREGTGILLQAVQQALAAIDRLPELFITAFALTNNGFNTDPLANDLARTVAELETGDYSIYFHKPGEKARYYLEDINPNAAAGYRKLCIMILYYSRQVEKLENFLHQHSRNIKCIDPIELAKQTADASVKKSFSTCFKTLIKIIRDYLCAPDRFKKKTDKLFNRGSKPTRDTKSRQCEKMWELSQTKHFENAYKLADAVILYSMREWKTAQYKDENLFLYENPKKRRNVQSQLVVRFQSWCKHNGKDYPFVTE